MIIRSDILTHRHLRDALTGIDDVIIEACDDFKPRRFERGYYIYLEALRETGFARNGRPGKAATWDEYGIWIDRLFKIDPDAEIGCYKGVDKFFEYTSRYVPRNATAPWLDSQ